MFGFLNFFKKKKPAPVSQPEPQAQAQPAPQAEAQAAPASQDAFDVAEFDELPDGKYVVLLKDQTVDGEQSILVNLEVQHGPHKGAVVTARFSDEKARKVAGEQSDSYLAFLAFEDHQDAYELVEAMDYSNEEANGEFIVVCEGGYVVSTPPYSTGDVEQLIAQL